MANSTIRVGHATMGDGGTISGGTPGDQGTEVCINENYNIVKENFKALLRPTRPELARKSAKACEDGCKNQNIGYDQDNRATLYEEAKKVDFDLSKITTPCSTDCSAFVTVCAIAGGATISTSQTTDSMYNATKENKDSFIATGDYEKYTDAKFFNSVDYLRRGDILVRPNGHALMILAESEDVYAIKPVINISNISCNAANVNIKIFKVEDLVEKVLDDINIINNYNWSYELKSISNTLISPITDKLTINNSINSFSLLNLNSSTIYTLTIIAKEKVGSIEFRSASYLFTTPKAYPTEVNNLKVLFNLDDYSLNKKFIIKFDEPTSWGNYSLQKGYRLFLIVNGNIKAFNDNLIKADSSSIIKVLNTNDIVDEKLFTYNDNIQIGILPFIIENDGDIIFENKFFRCSTPIVIKSYLTLIDKEYLKLKNTFKRLVLYNKRKAD